MKQYICPKELCDLYDTCPISHKMDVYEQSYPDSETGEVLYTATCKEIGETFCNLRSESLIGEDDCEEVSDNLDAESYICIMNMFFDKADDYFNRIMKSVSKHGPTKFVMPQGKIDSLKEMLPHQADEIDRVFREFAVNGFEPHQFLLPNNPFMGAVLQPFSTDFFEYRVKAGDEYYSSVELQNKINDKKERFRNYWGALFRKLNELLPGKSSVIRLESAASKMLDLFVKRLMFGGLFQELSSYNHAFDVLKEKLEDVAADLQEKNYERMQTAEDKRKRKSEALEAILGSNGTIKVKFAQDEKDLLTSAITEGVKKGVEDILLPGQSKICTAINKQNRSIDLLRKEIREGYQPPHERSSKNDKLVKKALDLREKLINNGTKERNATTEACLKIEEEYGLGDYKSSESFRDAVNTMVRERKLSHGLPEYPDGLKK